jgi:hypothetical protein
VLGFPPFFSKESKELKVSYIQAPAATVENSKVMMLSVNSSFPTAIMTAKKSKK